MHFASVAVFLAALSIELEDFLPWQDIEGRKEVVVATSCSMKHATFGFCDISAKSAIDFVALL